MFKQFRDTELTNKGFTVANASASGKTQYKITKAVSTATDISGYKTEDVKNLTSLPNEIDSGIITDYHAQDNKDNVSVIKLNFDNSVFKDGYEIRAVALYARVEGEANEFLHSVTITDSVVTIPAVSGNVYDGFDLDMAIFTGSNKNITVDIADENNATVKYVQDAIAQADVNLSKYVDTKTSNLQDQISTKANSKDLKSAIDDINGKLSEKTSNEDFNELASKSFTKGDDWISKLNTLDDVRNTLPNGFYQIGAGKFLPKESSGWGLIIKQTIFDTFITYIDQYNGIIWVTSYVGKWHEWEKCGGVDELQQFINDNFVKKELMDKAISQVNQNITDVSNGIKNSSIAKQKDYIGGTSGDILEMMRNKDDGIYYITNFTGNGLPDDFGNWGFLIRLSFGGDHTIMAISTNDDGSVWSNTFSGYYNSYRGWVSLGSKKHQLDDMYQKRDLVIDAKYQILDVFYLKDGYYHVQNNWNGAPDGFSGFGIISKISLGDMNNWPDVDVTLRDALGNVWTNTFGMNKWNGWRKIA